jgi:hypothetical protein
MREDLGPPANGRQSAPSCRSLSKANIHYSNNCIQQIGIAKHFRPGPTDIFGAGSVPSAVNSCAQEALGVRYAVFLKSGTAAPIWTVNQ